MNLRIFDVSQLTHVAGSKYSLSMGVVEDRGQYRAREIVCGGLSYALTMIERYRADDLVFVFDSPPTYRREIYSQLYKYGRYKGNRKPKPHYITNQYDLIYDVLTSLNITVLKRDEYEADDLIYNLVEQYHTLYNNIYIHTNDSDQFFLVRDNVSIIPVTRNRSVINIENYEECVNSNRYIKYNTILFDKLLYGDKSDAVSGINDKQAEKLLDTIPTEIYPMLGNVRFLYNLIRLICRNDRNVMLTAKLILPMQLDEPISITSTDLDMELFSFYAHYCSLKRYRNEYVHSQAGFEILNKYLEKE